MKKRKKRECAQCNDPRLKGIHTCELGPKALRENERLRLLAMEERAMTQLQENHSYMFTELARKADRETSQFKHNRETGKTEFKNAVAIRLIVPEDSWLGQRIVDMRERKRKGKD